MSLSLTEDIKRSYTLIIINKYYLSAHECILVYHSGKISGCCTKDLEFLSVYLNGYSFYDYELLRGERDREARDVCIDHHLRLKSIIMDYCMSFRLRLLLHKCNISLGGILIRRKTSYLTVTNQQGCLACTTTY